MRLAPHGFVRMSRTEVTNREMQAAGVDMPARDLQQRVALMRGLAVKHAEPPSPEAVTTPSLPPERTVSIAARPRGGESANAAVPPPWNAQRIDRAIERLAIDRGVTGPAVVELMKSCLRDLSMTVDQRAASLGRTKQSVVSNTADIRESLGVPGARFDIPRR